MQSDSGARLVVLPPAVETLPTRNRRRASSGHRLLMLRDRVEQRVDSRDKEQTAHYQQCSKQTKPHHELILAGHWITGANCMASGDFGNLAHLDPSARRELNENPTFQALRGSG